MDLRRCCRLCQRVFRLFSSKSFIVSGLISRSLIHFGLIFVFGIRECSNFILSMWLSSFPSTTYWRGCLFSLVYSCLLCHRLVGCRCMGWILGFLSCSTDVYFCLCASTMCFWWLLLCSMVWSPGAWFLQLHFSFSRCLWLFWVFYASKQTFKYGVWVLWKKSLVVW